MKQGLAAAETASLVLSMTGNSSFLPPYGKLINLALEELTAECELLY